MASHQTERMHLNNSFFYRYRVEIFLFLAALFIRFPFFFRDYIDKDESTFILMGQSIADGHLPYAHLWDLKPPLLFYFFAFIEKIFPHSFFAIRFFGTIVIFLSAILLMRIVKELKLKNGFLIALCYVMLSSEFGSLQGVMSEHFAVLFLLLGIYLFLKRKSNSSIFIRGVIFGCAILCKLNYAYAIVALMAFYFLYNWKKDRMRSLIYLALSIAGIILPIVLIGIPFVLSGKTNLFINSVFLAPLEYSKATNYTWLEKLKMTWWIIALTALVAYLAIKFSKEQNKFISYALIALLVGTVYTFFSSGIINGHYLVQVYPFLLILLLGVIAPKAIHVKLSLAAITVFLLSFESILEYGRVIKTIGDRENYRPTFEVVNELKELKLDKDKIFFANYHIGYWLLNQYPLTKSTTHPSNLSRPFLFKYFNDSNKTSLEELKFLMEDVTPEVVVSASNELDCFPGNSPENKYFTKTLEKDFKKVYEDANTHVFIWERANANKKN